MELSNKLVIPSYVSLETILQKSGVIFQNYDSITAVGYVFRTLTVDNKKFVFRKLKSEVLFNREGIIIQDNINIASAERAFLDAVFLYKDYHFDNLGALDWGKIMELKNIYENKVLNRRVEQYYEQSKT